MSNGTFEMGSTFKSFSLAMALDSGKFTMNDSFDARYPIRIGGFTIKDFHGKGRMLTMPEVFQYSSNIGTAKMADAVGIEGHKEFLTRLGLLTRMQTELPEVAMPSQPKVWKKINSITISFGHGVSTTPLQTAVAGAALVNGGRLIEPTFLPRSEQDAKSASKSLSSQRPVTTCVGCSTGMVLKVGQERAGGCFNVGGQDRHRRQGYQRPLQPRS